MTQLLDTHWENVSYADGRAVTTSDTGIGDAPDVVTNTGGSTVVYDTDSVPTAGGTRSVLFTRDASLENVDLRFDMTASGDCWYRIYFRAVTWGSNLDAGIFRTMTTSGTVAVFNVEARTTGTIRLEAQFQTPTTGDPETTYSNFNNGNWYRMDLHHARDTGTPANSSLDASFYQDNGTLIESLSVADVDFNVDVDQIRFGLLRNDTFPHVMQFDNLHVNDEALPALVAVPSLSVTITA